MAAKFDNLATQARRFKMRHRKEWAPIWQELSVVLLREGYLPLRNVEQWAKANKWSLRVLSDVMEQLSIEVFQCEDDLYVRLSGTVVPFLPREVRDVRTYRQVGNAA